MSETSPIHHPDSTGPEPAAASAPGKPPRRRAGRARRLLGRLVLTCLVLLLVLLAGHWVWGRVAASKLAATVAELERAEGPMWPGELRGPAAVHISTNAAIALREAADRIDRNDVAWDEASRLNDLAPPLAEAESALIGKALAPHGPTRTIVRAARRERRKLDWEIPVRSPLADIDVPDPGPQRRLAVMLAMAALDEHQRGNDAEAVELVRDVLFVARCNEHLPGLLPHSNAVGMSRMASERAAQLAPGLRVGGGGGAASPEQVDALVTELSDDEPIRTGFARAMRVERATQLDTARRLADGRMKYSGLIGTSGGWEVRLLDGVIGYGARPTMYEDGRLMLRHTTAAMKAVETSRDWPTAKAKLGNRRAEVEGQYWRHLVASVIMPSYERAAGVTYEATAEARLAAVALAARRYSLDHDGRLPEKLDDLVPEYLPAVPADPLAAGGPPLRYVGPAADAERPRAYGVGLNGRDDGGAEMDPDAPLRERERAGDLVRHLKRRPRPAREE